MNKHQEAAKNLKDRPKLLHHSGSASALVTYFKDNHHRSRTLSTCKDEESADPNTLSNGTPDNLSKFSTTGMIQYRRPLNARDMRSTLYRTRPEQDTTHNDHLDTLDQCEQNLERILLQEGTTP